MWGSFSTRLKAEGNEASRTTVLSVNRHKDDDSTGQTWSFHLRQVAVGDIGETSLVVELIEGAAAKKAKPWPKALKVLRQSFDAVAETGKPAKPYPNGPIVSVIAEPILRAEFYKGYPGNSDDPKQRKNTKAKAFARAVMLAREAELIGSREIDGEDMLWLAQIDADLQEAFATIKVRLSEYMIAVLSDGFSDDARKMLETLPAA